MGVTKMEVYVVSCLHDGNDFNLGSVDIVGVFYNLADAEKAEHNSMDHPHCYHYLRVEKQIIRGVI